MNKSNQNFTFRGSFPVCAQFDTNTFSDVNTFSGYVGVKHDEAK